MKKWLACLMCLALLVQVLCAFATTDAQSKEEWLTLEGESSEREESEETFEFSLGSQQSSQEVVEIDLSALAGCEPEAGDDTAIASESLPEGNDAASDFEIINGVLVRYTGPGGAVIVPNGVTAIGYQAFQKSDSVTSVKLPASVTTIGEYAFWNCKNLTHIDLPETLTCIERGAFYGCTSLESIDLPAALTSIENDVFCYCSSLTSVIIPDGVTSIEEEAFYYCNSLTSVSIPDSVTFIGTNAFFYCESLPSVRLPKGLTILSESLFHGCKMLSSINIPANVTSIEDLAFCGCGLKSASLPEGVTRIGDFAFFLCPLSEGINLPNSIANIGECAFNCCDMRGELKLPSKLTYLGPHAFEGSGHFTGDLVIPKGLTIIPECAFNASIYGREPGPLFEEGSLILHDGVERVEDSAFCCAGFTGQLTLSKKLKYIGPYGFACNYFEGKLVLPKGLKHIGKCAFYNNNFSGECRVPKSVTFVGEDAFGCLSITVIYDSEPAEDFEYLPYSTYGWYESTSTGVVIASCSQFFKGGHNIKLPTKAEGKRVLGVNEGAFSGCTSVTGTLVIPDGYELLSTQAFANCTGLTGTPVIPDSIRCISDGAFAGCTGLTGTLELSESCLLFNPETAFAGTNLTVVQGDKVIYGHGPVKPTRITFDKKKAELELEKKLQLKVTVMPKKAVTTLKWRSINKKVATVNSNGVVKAISKGNTTITVTTDNGKSASITINVVAPKPEKIKITNGKRTTMKTGEKLTLKVKLTPENAETKLTWMSSDSKVVTVSPKGVVKALKKGKAKITVRTHNGKKASVKIYVVAPKPEKIKITNGKRATMKTGEKLALKVKLTPEKAETKLRWKSSNKKVATVSKKGVVKALKKGKAIITVTTSNKKKALIRITVK